MKRDEDSLLDALSRAAKDTREMEDERLDERWDRLSAGKLSREEEAALRELAETSPEGREAWQAFRPLGADFRARMVGELVERTRADTAAEASPIPAQDGGGSPPGKILRFERWRPFVRRGALAAAALAAAVLLMVRGPEGPPPLPEYSLSLEGGVRDLRSEVPPGDAERVFAPGTHFELVLRPAIPVSQTIGVRFFLAGDGELRPLDLPAEISSRGAVRVTGEIGREIDVPPGEWVLWAVVLGPEASLDEAELLSSLASSQTSSADRIVLSTALRISTP